MVKVTYKYVLIFSFFFRFPKTPQTWRTTVSAGGRGSRGGESFRSMEEDQHERENDVYVLYQHIALDLSNLDDQELIRCSTDLYLTFERGRDLSEAISLHFKQGLISAVR